jgi:hypothetical protein
MAYTAVTASAFRKKGDTLSNKICDEFSNVETETDSLDTSVSTITSKVNYETGYIPIDITSVRIIDSNDIEASANIGGIVASDTNPALERADGATIKTVRLDWDTSADEIEIAIPPILKPPDLDETKNIYLKFIACMDGVPDDPSMNVYYADTSANTGTTFYSDDVSGNTATEYSCTILAASVTGHPGVINISFKPSAHTTNALWIYGMWLEYSRA